MKEITILYCVCENFFESILLRFPVPVPLRSVIKSRFRFRYGKKLRFQRFRFRNIGPKYVLGSTGIRTVLQGGADGVLPGLSH